MDKFDGVQRAEIVSVDYSCELTALPLLGNQSRNQRPPRHKCDSIVTVRDGEGQLLAKKNSKSMQEHNPAQKACKPVQPANAGDKRSIFTVLRYGFCALLLAVCLIGRVTSSETFTAASGFIKDELNKDYISEIYDG